MFQWPPLSFLKKIKGLLSLPVLGKGPLFIANKIGIVKITLFISALFAVFFSSMFRLNMVQDHSSLYNKASLTENPRPSYYKQHERVFYMRNIVIPIYIESVNSYKKLEADVVVIPSNKYIKEYLAKNIHLINDALNSTLEPVIPTFPLTEEGKLVITNKIKREINNVIKSLQIKGNIQYVYLHYIFAG